MPGSQAFSSTYNWIVMDAGEETSFTAYSLEGVVLDQDRIPAANAKEPRPYVLELAILGAVIFLAAFGWALYRVVVGKVR